MKTTITICVSLICFVWISACKKDKKTDTNTNTAPLFCNLASSTSSINDTIKQVINDTSYATANNTYYTQHLMSSDEGVSVDFEAAMFPAAGKYTIAKSFIEVIPGSKKCYVQYFRAGESYVGQSGIVEIGSDGAIYFCKIQFKNTFGSEHIVSLKSLIK